MWATALLLLAASATSAAPSDREEIRWPVLMPGATTQEPETYLCRSVEVPAEMDGNFVVGFAPNATAGTAHHILMFTCDEPGVSASASDQDPIWACGHGTVSGVTNAPVCNAGQQTIYGWARDAPRLELPADTGFPLVAGKSVVLQVHYKDVRPEPDASGIVLTVTPERQDRVAAVATLGHMGSVAPMDTTYLDMLCKVNSDVDVKPFAFRTHAHQLGRVISGYKIDPSDMSWHLIGKMDPRQPQMFYSVEDPDLTITSGDILAARCTMVSERDRVTYMGATNEDEMCNFYIMYSYDNADDNDDERVVVGTDLNHLHDCWNGNNVKLKDNFDIVPSDVSEFEGVYY